MCVTVSPSLPVHVENQAEHGGWILPGRKKHVLVAGEWKETEMLLWKRHTNDIHSGCWMDSRCLMPRGTSVDLFLLFWIVQDQTRWRNKAVLVMLLGWNWDFIWGDMNTLQWGWLKVRHCCIVTHTFSLSLSLWHSLCRWAPLCLPVMWVAATSWAWQAQELQRASVLWHMSGT